MNIQTAVLCDAATEYGGKLNLLGAFDAIHAQQLPVSHPQCAIALRMTFTDAEEGSHTLRLTFMDEDGQSIMRGIDVPVTVAIPAEAHFATSNIIVNIQQLKFDRPGLYSVDIAMDGKQEGSIPLFVQVVPLQA
ncbi:MAG: hypothetical protein JWQ71_3704 [Pedosphaera sp.]|nr:hypothetical protein [Pedosphaera sp.]